MRRERVTGMWRGLSAGLAGLLALAAGGAAALTAPEVSRTERAEVRLVADHRTAAPGTTVRLGLHQDLAPGWHTYWENPGDSGLAPTIAWTLPEGVEIGPIQWPAPKRMPYGPMVNYGYSDEAVLLSELTVPEGWEAGRPIPIRAEAQWLICADICVPEQASFTLTLPTGPAAEIALDTAAIVARGQASLPHPAAEIRATLEAREDAVLLSVTGPEFASPTLTDLYFFPAEWGLVDHAKPQERLANADGLVLRMPPGLAYDPSATGPVRGVLRATDTGGGGAVEIALALEAGRGPVALGTGSEAAGLSAVLAAAGLALLGGLVLNLMPCVFPVLALKALGLARHAGAAAAERRAEGLAYGAGVVVSFGAVAAALLALKAGGAEVGWGFHLQEPLVVGALAYLIFLVGLNLSGVFEISGRAAGLGQGLAERGGRSGSFFTGVLAVLVATPCTAPFMGAAIGFALTQSAWVTMTVFAGLAIGFALPLVALSMAPGLARVLPKPGMWMVRLRQALAFPMYLAAAWLVWVFGKLAGLDALFALLLGLVALGLAAWALGAGRPASAPGRRAAGAAALLAILGAGAALAPATAPAPTEGPRAAAPHLGAPFSEERLAKLRAEGRPVFVNFTADWCISCKVNERLVFDSPAFAKALKASDAAYLVADWTRRDGAILKVLERYGRAGVPLYLVYPADGGPAEVLPQFLTQGLVAGALTRAAPAISTAAAE